MGMAKTHHETHWKCSDKFLTWWSRAKKTVNLDLRKQAAVIKKQHCPATSKMNRKELISYIEKHQ